MVFFSAPVISWIESIGGGRGGWEGRVGGGWVGGGEVGGGGRWEGVRWVVGVGGRRWGGRWGWVGSRRWGKAPIQTQRAVLCLQ